MDLDPVEDGDTLSVEKRVRALHMNVVRQTLRLLVEQLEAEGDDGNPMRMLHLMRQQIDTTEQMLGALGSPRGSVDPYAGIMAGVGAPAAPGGLGAVYERMFELFERAVDRMARPRGPVQSQEILEAPVRGPVELTPRIDPFDSVPEVPSWRADALNYLDPPDEESDEVGFDRPWEDSADSEISADEDDNIPF